MCAGTYRHRKQRVRELLDPLPLRFFVGQSFCRGKLPRLLGCLALRLLLLLLFQRFGKRRVRRNGGTGHLGLVLFAATLVRSRRRQRFLASDAGILGAVRIGVGRHIRHDPFGRRTDFFQNRRGRPNDMFDPRRLLGLGDDNPHLLARGHGASHTSRAGRCANTHSTSATRQPTTCATPGIQTPLPPRGPAHVLPSSHVRLLVTNGGLDSLPSTTTATEHCTCVL